VTTDWAGLIDNWAVRFLHEMDYSREANNALVFKEQMAQLQGALRSCCSVRGAGERGVARLPRGLRLAAAACCRACTPAAAGALLGAA
jgi:hypothetical protein